MLDIQFIRQHVDAVKSNMLAKNESRTDLVDSLLHLDERWRECTTEVEQIRSEANQKAKQIGQLKAQGKHEEAKAIIEATANAKTDIKRLEEDLARLDAERYEALLQIPNMADDAVPVGKTPDDNVTVHTWGEIDPTRATVPHWDLAEEHGWLDFKRGAKVAGAGFPFYRGVAARLQRALINFFLDEAGNAGYEEILPPYVVNEDSARGTGQIPDKEDMMYTAPRDGLFLIPTAEVPVTNFFRDELLLVDELPIKFAAFSPCWRREAGSYGKDVRGLNRLHQFEKVELVKFVVPEDSDAELEALRRDAERLLEKLGLPYRTLLMCTGDMGFTQAKKYDLEVWSFGQQRWLEVSSCSNFRDFQARRMKLRFKTEQGTRFVHTLNGSGLALPRVMVAVMEQYQDANGNFVVPDVLKKWM